jgi:hypothetical protein
MCLLFASGYCHSVKVPTSDESRLPPLAQAIPVEYDDRPDSLEVDVLGAPIAMSEDDVTGRRHLRTRCGCHRVNVFGAHTVSSSSSRYPAALRPWITKIIRLDSSTRTVHFRAAGVTF